MLKTPTPASESTKFCRANDSTPSVAFDEFTDLNERFALSGDEIDVEDDLTRAIEEFFCNSNVTSLVKF